MVDELIREGFDLLQRAKIAMLTAIAEKVIKDGVFVYADYVEPENRHVKYDEDGNLSMCDEYDNVILRIEDLNASDLYDICCQIG